MEKNFSNKELQAICGNGCYQEVVEYLSSCVGSESEDLLNEYRRIFEKGEYFFQPSDQRIVNILMVYEDYLKWALMSETTTESCKAYIVECFKEFLPDVVDYEQFEIAFPAYFEELGYCAQFGVTIPFPDLYLWQSKTKREEKVELPEATVMMNVYEMDGIITRGWYDYFTFGKTGAGGWVSDDGAYYFKDKYDIDSDEFQISLLKHEGQHFHDLKNNPKMSSGELEYRAKLVELIYYKDEKCLNVFLDRMSDDPENPHMHANKRVIKDISKLLFSEELVLDKERWQAEYGKVAPTALKLLKEDTLRQDS